MIASRILRSQRRALLGDQFLGNFHSRGGIAAISVCTNRCAELRI